MSKPKYKKGRLITSLDELVKQPVIWYQFGIGHKVLAKGWFLSFQVNFIYNIGVLAPEQTEPAKYHR